MKNAQHAAEATPRFVLFLRLRPLSGVSQCHMPSDHLSPNAGNCREPIQRHEDVLRYAHLAAGAASNFAIIHPWTQVETHGYRDRKGNLREHLVADRIDLTLGFSIPARLSLRSRCPGGHGAGGGLRSSRWLPPVWRTCTAQAHTVKGTRPFCRSLPGTRCGEQESQRA